MGYGLAWFGGENVKYKVQIRGLRPYLQHRLPKDQEEYEKAQALVKKLKKDPFDHEAAKEAVELSVYKDEKGPYIPHYHIEQSLVEAGKQIRMKGQGKKTYKDYMKSYVFVEPARIRIQPPEYEMDCRYVVIQGKNKVLRYRPKWDEWSAEFTLIVTDDNCPESVIREVLEIAGSRVGIGDYRPRYGLYEVIEFKRIE